MATGCRSNRHFVRGGIPHRAPPLDVNLRRGDVLVIEEILDSMGTLESCSSVAVVAVRRNTHSRILSPEGVPSPASLREGAPGSSSIYSTRRAVEDARGLTPEARMRRR